MKITKKDLLFILIAVTLSVLTRTLFDLGENIEMITGFAIVAGFFLRNKRSAYILTLLSMVISDLFIRNTNIFMFTWTGFLVGPLLGIWLDKFSEKMKKSKFSIGLIGSQIGGLISTLIFFFWTNFGVWLIGNMYTKDLYGLTQSYINAIPFLTNQIIGNLVLVPLIFCFGYVFFNLELFETNVKKMSGRNKVKDF